MARVHKLVYGATEVDLLNTGGIIASRNGLGKSQFIPELDIPGDHIRIAERYTLNLDAASHDSAASTLKELLGVLRAAKQYHTEDWQNTPVYLQSQTTGETNPRYALVYGSTSFKMPDVFNHPFEIDAFVREFEVFVIRGAWRSAVPGTNPAALTFTKTDAPVDDDECIVANYEDSYSVTHIFNYDASAAAFSANLWGTEAFSLWSVSASTPATDDCIYIGSTDGQWNHVAIDIATAGVFSAGIEVEYYSTDAWITADSTEEYSYYPQSSINNLYQSTGWDYFNFQAHNVWTSTTINGVAAHWVRLRLSSVTSWTTTPVTSSDAPYTQKKPYLEFSSDILKGDMAPIVQFRMFSPDNVAASDGNMVSLSRIIMGAKSRNLTNFRSHLNAGGVGNSSDWTVTYDTDTTPEANRWSPGRTRANCTYSAVSTMADRVIYTGAGLLDDYIGECRVFMRMVQVGGSAGDLVSKLRFVIGSDAAQSPSIDGPEVKTEVVHNATDAYVGHILDMGTIKLPFADLTSTDAAGTDLIIKIMSERTTGTATARFLDVILIPIDEWSCVLDDPISNNDLGSSALWGMSALDLDGGILANRTLKYTRDSTDLTTLYPAETWYRSGEAPKLEPGRQTRIYFLMGNYYPVGGWGVAPLFGTLGSMLRVEMRAQALYHALRGSG